MRPRSSVVHVTRRDLADGVISSVILDRPPRVSAAGTFSASDGNKKDSNDQQEGQKRHLDTHSLCGLPDGAKLLDEGLRNQATFLDGNIKGDHAAFLDELAGQ